MTRYLLLLLLALAGSPTVAQLPPQALSRQLQPGDCQVIRRVLDAYAAYGKERGESSGFTGLHFFVGHRSQELSAREIPVSRFDFSPDENVRFDRIQSQRIFSSLVRRAGFSADLTRCDLPPAFAFADSFESVHAMSDEPWLSIMFQEYDGFVVVTLPGYSSDECQALVELYARYPIWEERLIYYLRASDDGWSVEYVFPSYLRGE